MKIASHREVDLGLIGIGLKGSTSLDLSVYGNFPLWGTCRLGAPHWGSSVRSDTLSRT